MSDDERETALLRLLARWESLAHLNSAVEKFCDELAHTLTTTRTPEESPDE